MQQLCTTIKEYVKRRRLVIPLVLVAVSFVLIHAVWGKAAPRRIIYLNLAFYLFIIVWYIKVFREKCILDNVRTVQRFLAFSFLSLCCLHLAYLARDFLIRFSFETWGDNGIIDQRVTESFFAFTLYAIVMLVIMPIGEELFFRYAVISFSSKKNTAVTVVFSLFLYVLINADHPSGVLTLTVPALVLTVTYLLTKNLYVTIFVHVIYSIVLNGEFIGYAFARMLYR